jgi:hypothetical protein
LKASRPGIRYNRRGGDPIMRNAKWAMLVLLAAGAATMAAPAPAAAGDYPWCIQGDEVGYPGECSYYTYAQCMASASGRRVYCGINPRAAYGAYGSQRPKRSHRYPRYCHARSAGLLTRVGLSLY